MAPDAHRTPLAPPAAGAELWSAVDDYMNGLLVPEDEALLNARRASEDAGLPPIAVTPNQGKLLALFARMVSARSILELGTLGAYSTIWLARALPEDGWLVTLEANPRFAEVARANIARAGLSERVLLRVGEGLHTLPELVAEEAGPFDMIFVDADKKNNPGYLQWSLKLSRPGTLIVVDNVVRDGRILDPAEYRPDGADPDIAGIRRFFQLLAAEPRVDASAIQMVGAKGHDGFALAIVRADASA
ncbi:MAG TPA: O-methyltransferase [Solirubrobacteraceae bacterium]|nr:O-methyltransferase [Solirubrobacteraceae bacterium]